eukprot:SAG31_NODE_32510_length_355_cov_0.609375_1_plen_89_part_00
MRCPLNPPIIWVNERETLSHRTQHLCHAQRVRSLHPCIGTSSPRRFEMRLRESRRKPLLRASVRPLRLRFGALALHLLALRRAPVRLL